MKARVDRDLPRASAAQKQKLVNERVKQSVSSQARDVGMSVARRPPPPARRQPSAVGTSMRQPRMESAQPVCFPTIALAETLAAGFSPGAPTSTSATGTTTSQIAYSQFSTVTYTLPAGTHFASVTTGHDAVNMWSTIVPSSSPIITTGSLAINDRTLYDGNTAEFTAFGDALASTYWTGPQPVADPFNRPAEPDAPGANAGTYPLSVGLGDVVLCNKYDPKKRQLCQHTGGKLSVQIVCPIEALAEVYALGMHTNAQTFGLRTPSKLVDKGNTSNTYMAREHPIFFGDTVRNNLFDGATGIQTVCPPTIAVGASKNAVLEYIFDLSPSSTHEWFDMGCSQIGGYDLAADNVGSVQLGPNTEQYRVARTTAGPPFCYGNIFSARPAYTECFAENVLLPYPSQCVRDPQYNVFATALSLIAIRNRSTTAGITVTMKCTMTYSVGLSANSPLSRYGNPIAAIPRALPPLVGGVFGSGGSVREAFTNLVSNVGSTMAENNIMPIDIHHSVRQLASVGARHLINNGPVRQPAAHVPSQIRDNSSPIPASIWQPILNWWRAPDGIESAGHMIVSNGTNFIDQIKRGGKSQNNQEPKANFWSDVGGGITSVLGNSTVQSVMKDVIFDGLF